MASQPNLSVSTKPDISINKLGIGKPFIPVRQTLTSKLRLERGNPLIYLKNNLEKLKETTALLTPRPNLSSNKNSVKAVATFIKPEVPSTSNKKASTTKNNDRTTRTNSTYKENRAPNTSILKSNSLSIKKSVKFSSPKNEQVSNLKSKQSRVQSNKNSVFTKTKLEPKNIAPKTCSSKTSIKTESLKNNSKSKIFIGNEKKSVASSKSVAFSKPPIKLNNNDAKKKSVKAQSPLRKSLSAMHLKRVSIRDPNAAIFRSLSSTNMTKSNNVNEHTPIAEENEFMFHTPSMAKRRSIILATPMTLNKNQLSPWSGCWSPSAKDLKRRLSIWLEGKGKPKDSFHHLRCFGMHYIPEELPDEAICGENKENFEVTIPDKNSSYEQLNVDPDKKKKDIVLANEALYDLLKLIEEGYPRDQCEAWLDVIRTRFEEVEDKPQYWECMAALEEARGDVTNALDYCKNAIVKGAEIDKVDQHLERLLETFNVLNISPKMDQPVSTEKKNKVLDARNVFKSSIINFAVQERTKTNGESTDNIKFTVTPVRRSTRRRTQWTPTTPGITIHRTMNELDPSVRNNCEFKINKALKK